MRKIKQSKKLKNNNCTAFAHLEIVSPKARQDSDTHFIDA